MFIGRDWDDSMSPQIAECLHMNDADTCDVMCRCSHACKDHHAELVCGECPCVEFTEDTDV